jgi:hypothetical protein
VLSQQADVRRAQVLTGFKGSLQRCGQELRWNSTDGGHPIGHNEPECGRQVVRRWRVEKIDNASGRQ